MRLFAKQSEFIRLRNGLVIEHRRLITPLFWFRLKSRYYEYYDFTSDYLQTPFGSIYAYGHKIRYHGWRDSKKYKVMDDDLTKILDLTNDRIKDNVIYPDKFTYKEK